MEMATSTLGSSDDHGNIASDYRSIVNCSVSELLVEITAASRSVGRRQAMPLLLGQPSAGISVIPSAMIPCFKPSFRFNVLL